MGEFLLFKKTSSPFYLCYHMPEKVDLANDNHLRQGHQGRLRSKRRAFVVSDNDQTAALVIGVP